MAPKSIFRQHGAQHFQLVHRSQRDPLIHDPDASQYVLKHVLRENPKKGKSRADLEALLPSSELNHDLNYHVGEAALYGIYYDDTQYNYLQHLRQYGMQEDGVESILIEAPSSSKKLNPRKKSAPLQLIDLPSDVFPSATELSRTYQDQQQVPESIAGFQPNMDPHLRQTLEALEDDEYIDDDLKDDFFGQIVADGLKEKDDAFDYEFCEEGASQENVAVESGENLGWEEIFAQFKTAQKDVLKNESEDGLSSEGRDTVGDLPVIGGKGSRRRKGTSNASGYSMSSSSMYRNEALQTLDERFDQIILKEYNEEEDDMISDEEDDASDVITSREDFDSMVNEFLNDFEILGRKMKLKLAGETGAQKLDTIRRALGLDERVQVSTGDDIVDDAAYMPYDMEDKKERWDCETILTTYSNLENHPRLIRASEKRKVPKIVLDSRTGLPSVTSINKSPNNENLNASNSEFDSDNSDDDHTVSGKAEIPVGYSAIPRSREETKEEKKLRKAAVKAERQARRMDKKSTKEQFGAELKTQKKMIRNKEYIFKKM